MRFILSLFAFLLFCFLSPVYPHAILQTPTARQGQAVGVGRKIPQPEGPSNMQLQGCGPAPDGITGADPGPGPIAATYTAGQQITVSWKITIGHPSDPGVRVAVKYSDTDGFNNNVLASRVNVEANLVGTTASTTVRLPAGKTSQNAVLQWIWHSIEDGGYYIACSDIRINAANGGATTTAAPATTTRAATTTRPATTTAGATTTADPDAETTEGPETTEAPETTEPAATTESPEETTTPTPADGGEGGATTLPDDGTGDVTTTLRPVSTVRTTTRTTTRRATTRRPINAGQQQATSAAAIQTNTAIALLMASVMAAFFRLFH